MGELKRFIPTIDGELSHSVSRVHSELLLFLSAASLMTRRISMRCSGRVLRLVALGWGTGCQLSDRIIGERTRRSSHPVLA